MGEFNSFPKELGKHPAELHIAKQRLMHGSEINNSVKVRAKSAPKRKRRGFADMLRLAAGVAATAIVAVSTAAPATETVDYGKYHFFVSYPTYKLKIEPGGYGAYLDLSTEGKRQALSVFCTEWIYGFTSFMDKYGDEMLDDANKNERLHPVHLSKNQYDFGNYLGMDTWFMGESDEIHVPWMRAFLRYDSDGGNFIRTREYDMSGKSSVQFFCMADYIDIKSTSSKDIISSYGDMSRDEILTDVAQKVDDLFMSKEILNDKKTDSLSQFTVYGKGGELIVPEFIKVVRNDEIYGYRKLTVPKDGDYFLITGSDKQPLSEPWKRARELFLSREVSGDRISGGIYASNNKIQESAVILSNSFIDHTDFFMRLDVTDAISNPDYDNLTGTDHVYYELALINTRETLELIVPQVTRLVPVEDEYYVFRLSDHSGTYTITNNGDHEVVVIGNLELEGIFSGLIRLPNGLITREGEDSRKFAYEPLVPGESLTINVKSGVLWDTTTWLTMPECCTVTDSGGREYTAGSVKIDLVKGKVRVD